MKKLEGYKTYLLAVILIIVGVLHTRGWFPAEIAVLLYPVLVGAIAASLRSGMKKDNEKLGEKLMQEIKKQNGGTGL